MDKVDPLMQKLVDALRSNARNPRVDSIKVAAAGATATSLTQRMFQTSTGKTMLDTNNLQSGQFAYTFLAKGVRIGVVSRAGAPNIDDVNKILANATLRWKKGPKELIREIPLFLFTAGFGVQGVLNSEASSAGTGNLGTGTNGTPDQENYFKILPEKFDKNDSLDMTVQFYDDISALTGGEDLYLYVVVEGVSAESIS